MNNFLNKLKSRRVQVGIVVVVITLAVVSVAVILPTLSQDNIGSPVDSRSVPLSEIEEFLPEGSDVVENPDGTFQISNEDLEAVIRNQQLESLDQIEDMPAFLKQVQESLAQSAPGYKYFKQEVMDPSKGGKIRNGHVVLDVPKGFYSEPLVFTFKAKKSTHWDKILGYRDSFELEAMTLLGENISTFDKELKIKIELIPEDLMEIGIYGFNGIKYRNQETDEWVNMRATRNSKRILFYTGHFTNFTSSDDPPEVLNVEEVSCGLLIDESESFPCFLATGVNWQNSAVGYRQTSIHSNYLFPIISSASWNPDQDLSSLGEIEIFVNIPDLEFGGTTEFTTEAVYWIVHKDGLEAVTVNQREEAGKVISLGEFEFIEEQGMVNLVGYSDYQDSPIELLAVADAIAYGEGAVGPLLNLDTTPPEINDVVGITNKEGFMVTAVVTDASGIGQVNLIVNGKSYPMVNVGGNKYAVLVKGLEGKDIDYFITAYDNPGNESIWRGGPNEGYISRGTFGENDGVAPWSFYMGKGIGHEVPSPIPGSNLCNQFCGDPINTLNGNLFEKVDLLDIGGRPGIDLDITYNSQGSRSSIFGESWTHSYNYKLTYIENSLFTGAILQYPDGRQVQFDGRSLVAPAGTFETLSRVGNGFELKFKDLSRVRLNASGDVTKIYDANNNTLTFSYRTSSSNNISQLNKIKASGGRQVEFTYNTRGLVSQVWSSDRSITFKYNGSRDLVTIIDARGNSTVYDYDGSHNILRKVSAKGHNVYVNTFDNLHRVTSQKAGDRFKQTYKYSNNKTIVTDRNGNVATYYFTDGLFTKLVDEAGGVMRYEYNGQKQVIKMIDPEGNVTTFEYDSSGNQVKSTDGLGQDTLREFSPFVNRLTKESFKTAQHITKWGYDSRGNLVRVTNALGGTSEFEYDNFGQLTKSKDFNGNSTTLSYNSFGDLTKVQDAEGNTVKFSHDSLGRKIGDTDALGNNYGFEFDGNDNLVAVNGPLGLDLGFEYDKNNHLVKEIDSLGGVTTYKYDKSDALSKATDALGNATSYEYGIMNELAKQTDPLGRVSEFGYTPTYLLTSVVSATGDPEEVTSTFGYNAVRRQTSTNNPRGKTSEVTYDALHRVTQQIEDVAGLGAKGTLEYDAVGNVVRVTDAEGNSTTYEYDLLNRVTRTIDAQGNSVSFEYDSNGNLVKSIDSEGNVTGYRYDGINRVTLVRDALGGETRLKYDGNSNLISSRNQNGVSTKFEYDALNRRVKTVQGYVDALAFSGFLDASSSNLVTTFEYDLNGNLIKTTNPRGNSTEFAYDALNRSIQVTDVNGNSSTFAYDAVNNLVGQTDRNSNSTKYVYDALNRLVSSTNAKGHKVKYSYDKGGNIVGMVDGRGNTTKFAYNGLDHLTKTVDALGGITRFNSDLVDNLVSQTDANGHTNSYSYNGIYNITKSINAEGHFESFRYDKNGNLVRQIDANGNAASYRFDDLNRLVGATDAMGGNTSFQFDALGNLLSLNDANSHVDKYSYDQLNRQNVVIDAEGNRSEVAYDRNGNVVKVTDANNNATSFGYDSLDRLVSQTNAEGEKVSFEYDNEGNQITKVDPDGVRTAYSYDEVYRLVGVNLNDTDGGRNSETNVNTAYKYDANNNLTKIVDPKGNSTTFGYDSLNRQIKELDANGRSWNFGYDAVGNKTSRVDAKGKSTSYGYAADNLLTSVSYANGTGISYSYDSSNNKVVMNDSLGQTAWQYDALNRMTFENDSLGNTKSYGYDLIGNLTTLSYPDGSQVNYRYLANDWLEGVTDPTGAVTSYGRDSVGNVVNQVNGNGSQTQTEYDNAYRKTVVSNLEASGQVNSSFNYSYNSVGQIEQTRQHYVNQPRNVTSSYSYDPIRRLTSSQRTDGVHSEYRFDRAGNRKSWVSNDDITTPNPFDSTNLIYDYNKINQLIRVREDVEPSQTKPRNNKLAVQNPGQTRKESREVPIPQASLVFVDNIHQFINQLEAQQGKQISTVAYTELMKQVNKISDKAEDGLLIQSEAKRLINKLIKTIEDYAVTGEIKSSGTATALITKLKNVKTFIAKLPVVLDTYTVIVDVAVVNNNVVSSPLNTLEDPLKKIEYRYDSNGNRVRREEYGPSGPAYQMTRYTYDPEDRIASITGFDSSKGSKWNVRDITAMQYDGAGRRLVKTYDPKSDNALIIEGEGKGSKRTEYTYNGLDVISLSSTWNNQHQNLYRDNNQVIISSQRFSDEENKQNFFHYDGLGSVVGTTSLGGQSDNTRYEDYGQIVKPGNSEAKGKKISAIAPHNVFTYTGQELDPANGLYEFYSRAYDPEVGVWLQQDRYRGRLDAPKTLHRYGYVLSDPIGLKDNYGYFAISGSVALGYAGLTAVGAGAGYLASTIDFQGLGGWIGTGVTNVANGVGDSIDWHAQKTGDFLRWCGGLFGGATVSSYDVMLRDIGRYRLTQYFHSHGNLTSYAQFQATMNYNNILNSTIPMGVVGFIGIDPDDLDDLPEQLRGPKKPTDIQDPQLKKMVDQLYRDGAKYGNGGTGDALRWERLTGDLLSNSGHYEKVVSSVSRLIKWFNNNPGAAKQDIDIAIRVIDDLISALNF